MKNTLSQLTPTQRSLLIFLYNEQDTMIIDEGNLCAEYAKITDNPDFDIKDFLMDTLVLITRKLVKTNTHDTFYKITDAGKKLLKDSHNDIE